MKCVFFPPLCWLCNISWLQFLCAPVGLQHHVQPPRSAGTSLYTSSSETRLPSNRCLSLMHGGYHANSLGVWVLLLLEFIIARNDWECCEREPDTNRFFFSMKSIVREIQRNVPNVNLKKTPHRLVATSPLCVRVCTHLNCLYYVLE